jgi:hypothetical protein
MIKNVPFLYGLNHPKQLLDKMKSDGRKLESDYDWENVFNFFVTASVLNNWVQGHYDLKDSSLAEVLQAKTIKGYPENVYDWFIDKSCFPNEAFELMEQVRDCLNICCHVCNASKHYDWSRKEDVDGVPLSIGREPVIKDYYQYFFTKTGPGLFVEIQDQNYCITQIRDILCQFYEGLLGYLENDFTKSS